MNKKFYIGAALVVVILLIVYLLVLPKKADLNTVQESEKLSKQEKESLEKHPPELQEWIKSEFSKPLPKSTFK